MKLKGMWWFMNLPVVVLYEAQDRGCVVVLYEAPSPWWFMKLVGGGCRGGL
jgi:hypothetical protein